MVLFVETHQLVGTDRTIGEMKYLKLKLASKKADGIPIKIPVVDENMLKPKAVVSIMCSIVSGAGKTDLRTSVRN